MAVRIYTDNGCDLDRTMLDELGVGCFYISTMLGGVTYLDRYNLDPPEFYRMLQEEGGVPTTAQITPQTFLAEFEKTLAQTKDDIIYIAFSSGLSGTYQNACLARDQLDKNRITVIDSKCATVAQGLIVVRAARARVQGSTKEELIAQIENDVRRIEMLFIVGNFEMLKRGGRVSATSATLGNLLNIKLILHFVDGKIFPLEKVRGLKKAQKRLLDLVDERLKDRTRPLPLIGVNHSQDEQAARDLKQLLEERFGYQDFLVSEIGAVIGSHVGAGTMGVYFLR
ncbi:MAG: DegV family protein [Syntrophomonadaceae bacterium]